MTDRTTLALAACQGLSDTELAERGQAGYQKMRDRKRHYAGLARAVTLALAVQNKHVKQLQAQVAQLQATIAELQNLDAPVTDTSAAAAMLAGIGKKGGA